MIAKSQPIIKCIVDGKDKFKEINILESPKKAAATTLRKYLNHGLLSYLNGGPTILRALR